MIYKGKWSTYPCVVQVTCSSKGKWIMPADAAVVGAPDSSSLATRSRVRSRRPRMRSRLCTARRHEHRALAHRPSMCCIVSTMLHCLHHAGRALLHVQESPAALKRAILEAVILAGRLQRFSVHKQSSTWHSAGDVVI